MDSGKKIIKIIILVATLIIVGIGVYCVTVCFNNDKEETEVKKEVVSVVILDINPSIKIELDKDNKVISVTPLNTDAKDIIPENLEGKELKEVVSSITDNLKEKGIVDEEVTILVNVEGKVDKEVVETVIKETFTEKEIEVKVINQETTETSKENAEKYNISESKAAYIEEVLKDNENLTFEDLKDKSIEEIEAIKNEPEPEPEPEPSPSPTPSSSPKQNNNSGSNSNSGSNNNSGSSGSSKQPSDPTKDLDEWCKYNKNGNPKGHEKPMMRDSQVVSNEIESYLNNKYGISSRDYLSRYVTNQEDRRSSYCVAHKAVYVTRNWYKTIIIDSVTGTIIEETDKAVPSFKYGELEARNVALSSLGLTVDDAWDYAQGEVYLRMDGMGGPNEGYYYQITLDLKDGRNYTINMNAVTGEITSTRQNR